MWQRLPNFFKIGHPVYRLFSSFQTSQFLQLIYVKNVHPVYGPGIRTHNLQNVSLLPQSLDQGSRPRLPNFHS